MGPKDLEFGLLGERLGHSFSPAIHRQLAGYDYRLVELPPEEVEPFLRAGRFRGLNVTIPYKKTVMPAVMPSPPLPGELAASTPFSAARTGLSTEITRTTTGSATCSRPPGPRCAEKKFWCWGPAEPPLPSMRCWPTWAPGRR